MCASCAGYNLHAGVALGARDRAGLERLGRYLLRLPLAETSLTQEPDGSVVFEMKRAYADGTAALRFTPEELVSRLSLAGSWILFCDLRNTSPSSPCCLPGCSNTAW